MTYRSEEKGSRMTDTKLKLTDISMNGQFIAAKSNRARSQTRA